MRRVLLKPLAALAAVAAGALLGCADLDQENQVDGFGTGGVAIAGPPTSVQETTTITNSQVAAMAETIPPTPTPTATTSEVVTTGESVVTSQAATNTEAVVETETSPPGFSEDCIALGYMGYCDVYGVGFDIGLRECIYYQETGEIGQRPDYESILTPGGADEFFAGLSAGYVEGECDFR